MQHYRSQARYESSDKHQLSVRLSDAIQTNFNRIDLSQDTPCRFIREVAIQRDECVSIAEFESLLVSYHQVTERKWFRPIEFEAADDETHCVVDDTTSEALC